MKINNLGLEMIHLQEFARLLGYSNWFDEKMFKEHGQFMARFREDDWIEKDLAHFYIVSRGLGTFLKPLAPLTLCLLLVVNLLVRMFAAQIRCMPRYSKLFHALVNIAPLFPNP